MSYRKYTVAWEEGLQEAFDAYLADFPLPLAERLRAELDDFVTLAESAPHELPTTTPPQTPDAHVWQGELLRIYFEIDDDALRVRILGIYGPPPPAV